MKKTATLIISFILPYYCLADSIEISLFNKIAGIAFNADITSAYESSFSYTHSQHDNKDANLATAAFFARGIRDQMTGKIGAQTFWLNGSHHDTYGIAIGGGLKYLITPELWTSGEAFYAPDIIVGGDFQNYYNISLLIGYNVLPHASIFLGYQNTGVNDGNKNREIYNGAKLGINFRI